MALRLEAPQRAVDDERGFEVASHDRSHIRYQDPSIDVLFEVESLAGSKIVLYREPIVQTTCSCPLPQGVDPSMLVERTAEGLACMGLTVEVADN